MSRKYKFRSLQSIYFITYTVVDWIDLFVRNEYRDIIINSYKHCIANKGLDLYAWVIMTSHIHAIVGSHGEKLENIMRDSKKWTSQQLRNAITGNLKESRREWMLGLMKNSSSPNSEFQLWQPGNHPIELYNPEIAEQKLNYIHFNPVKAGFTDVPENYLYSSARDYYTDKKGLIEIEKLILY